MCDILDLIDLAPSATVSPTVQRLVDEAGSNSSWDRRSKDRYPFFRPATISLPQDRRAGLPAFTRDVSWAGIGLLHLSPVRLGEVNISIPTDTGEAMMVRVKLSWCEDCGEGWYVSGGRFLD